MDGPDSAAILEFEGFRFDRARACLFRLDQDGAPGEPVTLGSRALDLLAQLVTRPGQLVSKDEIMDAVWAGAVVEESNLTVQISALRRVLDRDRAEKSCIQTVPGRGYRFVAPVVPVQTAAPAFCPGAGGQARGSVGTGGEKMSLPAPVRGAPQWTKRAIIAAVSGLVCLTAVVLAAMDLHALPPWGHSLPRYLSIVVLPFQNLSSDPDGQRLADAVTADLTTDLSHVWNLLIIPPDVASRYRGKPMDAKQIGSELGVRYILDGSIQRSDDRVETNFRLIDAKSGQQLQAARFDAETANIIEMQNEITGRIARTLYYTVAQVERHRIEQERPEERSAPDLVMLGWARLNRPDANLPEVQRIFERALLLDPHSVNARLGLAKLLMGQLVYPLTGANSRAEARIEQLLSEALKIGGNLTQTYATTGHLRMLQNRLAESRIELEMAVELDHSNSWANYQLGITMMYLGQPQNGIGYIETAIRLNPSYPNIGYYYWGLGACHLLLGHVDEAIDLLRKARAANPRPYYVHQWLAGALGLAGDLDEARAALEQMQRIRPDLTSLEAIRIHFPWSTNPEHLAFRQHTIDLGLRRAGFPDR